MFDNPYGRNEVALRQYSLIFVPNLFGDSKALYRSGTLLYIINLVQQLTTYSGLPYESQQRQTLYHIERSEINKCDGESKQEKAPKSEYAFTLF